MSDYQYEGFGALSEWNGQVSDVDAAAQYAAIAATGANTISLSPRLWTDTGSSSDVLSVAEKTESAASLIAGIKTAEAAGLQVILRPMITGLDGTASYDLAPSDTAAFFASYKAQIVEYAKIAEATGVSVLSIGNELGALVSSAYRAEWTDIVSAVRAVYHGDLTYSAAMNEASSVSFWDQVDVIGVNAYASLSNTTDPSVADLKAAWNEVPVNDYWAQVMDNKSPVDFIKSLSETYDKQVLLTEIGYRSIDGGATNPGDWASSADSDLGDQANAYQAFLETWTAEGGSWLAGYNFWQWDLDGKYEGTGYSPMGKPAQAIASQYFHGEGLTTGVDVAGSAVNDVIDLGRGNDHINAGLGNDVIRGGAGDDVIVAGPASVDKLATTTITFTAFGTAVNGEQAKIQIWVNGQPVGAEVTLSGASDTTDYQTYTVTFTNPATITSLDFALMNATPGRAAFFRGIEINGYEVNASDVTNASAPGTFQLWVNTIHMDGTAHADLFYGAGTDNDLIEGGKGNDTIDGGAGIDTAVYSGSFADYLTSFNGDVLTIADGVAGRDGTDTLTNVEYLQFKDKVVSVADLKAASAPTVTTNVWSWGREVKTVYADGHSVATAYDLTGAVLKTNAIAADGSRVFTEYKVAGKGYVSQTIDYDASDRATHTVQYRADGSLYGTISYAADGSKVTDVYDTSGKISEHATVGASGAATTANYTDGVMTRYLVVDATGEKHLSQYGITGKGYVSQTLDYDASGRLADTVQYRADGGLYGTITYGADGSKATDVYDASGKLSEHASVAANGATSTTSYVDGVVTRMVEIDASGDKHLSQYGITGKSYDAQTLHYDASGAVLNVSQHMTDGTTQLTIYAASADSMHGYDIINSNVSIAADQGTTGAIKLMGTAAINATGNDLANVIIGNSGANVVAGGLGADTLTGGAGKDIFVFNTALGGGNVDAITDFNVKDDTMRLDSAVFTALSKGALSNAGFYTGAAAHDATDRIIYNKATGALFYDDDGNGAHAATQIATLAKGLAITHADFVVV